MNRIAPVSVRPGVLVSASIAMVLCLGCHGGGSKSVDADGLDPSVHELVKASEEGEAKRLEFLKTLRELISRKGGSERDVLEWHGNGGQSFREGEATPIKVNGRRFVTVILWSVDLNLPGDFPIRLLLLGGDGSILDQVDCFGEAFYVRLGAAASDSSVGESAAVYVSASFERKDWKGSLFVIHGSERLEIPFPRAGQEEKESVNGVTFLKIGISKDRFETPDLIR